MFTRRFWLKKQMAVRHRLTLRAWAVLAAAVVALGVVTFQNVYPWLAVTHPVTGCDALAVEGWVPDYVVGDAAGRFRTGEAAHFFTTGLLVERGGILTGWHNYAEVATGTLVKLGVPVDKIDTVPTPYVLTDRTIASAEALKAVLEPRAAAGEMRRCFNVITLGAHARRTWQCYRKVFGPEWEIGVRAIPTEEFDEAHWWRTSAGIKSVAGETSAVVRGWVR